MADELKQDAQPLTVKLDAASETVKHRLDTPLDNEGLPVTGVEGLETGHTEDGHVTPAVFGLDATVFVSLSMLVVIALVLWKKVPAAIGGSLDRKIANIREQLDEAKKLREESEELRARYESRLRAADDEAAEILAQAEREAELVVADAKQATTDLIARRKKMAEDKISAAERSAIAEVRAKAAGAATLAAQNLIAGKHDAAADKAMIDQNIADLGSTIN
ncbi:MAG: F0F1 ATP synthase subunit B [Parasphingorhabdus sp.]|uniref:F0F1 ATP synthase subunit B family protein n=1 Tax=Parasphingorhabdus sp. TaxID=2709688 RepID=UPI0030028CC9